MSSYATLSIDLLELASSRNHPDSDIMWMFRPSDKHVKNVTRSSRDILSKYITDEHIDDFDEDNPLTCVEYRCTVSEARDRLELRGFTYDVARAGFEVRMEAEIRDLEDGIRIFGRTESDEATLKVLRSLTVESWLDALNLIWKRSLAEEPLTDLLSTEQKPSLLPYMLRRSAEFYGIPGLDYGTSENGPLDYLLFYRLAIEAVPSCRQLVYDLTDLASGGWIGVGDDCVADAESQLLDDAMSLQKVIVLTEGNTDKYILERTLPLLYPHLADYFHFFDFSGNRGGAGELVNLLRAFAAAGIRHRILALFDNDSAAKEALRNFDSSFLPRNITFRHYPEIPLAKQYPTLGPSGNILMNVNGLAGSIELYLGEDVLRDDHRQLVPVQWTGYQRGVDAYQGVIQEKRRILERFKNKLDQCEADPTQIGSYDWGGLRAIVETMRTAFHDVDAQVILSGLG